MKWIYYQSIMHVWVWARSNPTYPLSCGASLRRFRHVVPDATVSDYCMLHCHENLPRTRTIRSDMEYSISCINRNSVVRVMRRQCKNLWGWKSARGIAPPGKHNFYRLNFITLFQPWANIASTITADALPTLVQRRNNENFFLNLLCLKLSIICILW